MAAAKHSRNPITVMSSKALQPAPSMHGLRCAVAVSEPEDATMTGMTRSLDRRLLALNLQPIPPGSEILYMKVA